MGIPWIWRSYEGLSDFYRTGLIDFEPTPVGIVRRKSQMADAEGYWLEGRPLRFCSASAWHLYIPAHCLNKIYAGTLSTADLLTSTRQPALSRWQDRPAEGDTAIKSPRRKVAVHVWNVRREDVARKDRRLHRQVFTGGCQGTVFLLRGVLKSPDCSLWSSSRAPPAVRRSTVTLISSFARLHVRGV